MSDYILEVYEADDETLHFEVGTAADHANPYLQMPEVFSESEIDLQQGTSRIGRYNIGIIDPQTGATQADRFLTALLGNSDGYSEVNGRRTRLRHADGTIVLDGICAGPSLHPTFAGFTLALEDIRARGIEVPVFNRSGTTSIFPRGVVDGYGQFSSFGLLLTQRWQWLAPPTEPATGTVVNNGTGVGLVILGGTQRERAEAGWTYNEKMGRAVQAGWSENRRKNVLLSAEVWIRETGESAWTKLRHMPVVRSWDPLTVRAGGLFLVDEEKIDGEVETITTVQFGEVDGFEIPANDTAVDIMVVYTGPPTDDYRFHFEGTAGELLRNVLRGDYSWTEEADGTWSQLDPGIRYDDDAFVGEDAPQALKVPVRMRLDEPAEDLREWFEDACKDLGVAPALDELGRVAPVGQQLPDESVTLPEINDANAEPIAAWEHPITSAITQVEIVYPRDFRIPEEDDPDGSESGGDGIATVEQSVTVKPNDETIQQVMGVRRFEIGGSLFRALGNSEGAPEMLGDFMNEEGAQHVYRRGHELIDRFAFGGQTDFVRVRRDDADMAAVKVGDWVLDGRSWSPNYATGERGRNHLVQVVSIRDVNAAWREFRIVDAAPYANPVGQPTLGVITESGGVVSVPITAIASGSEARIDYAISSTVPDTGSERWIYLGRTASTGTLQSPPLPSGLTVWIRARGEKEGRRPSAWTDPVSIVLTSVARLRNVNGYIRNGTLGETADWHLWLRWENNDDVQGLRIYYKTHSPSDPIPTTFTDYVDVDADPGEAVIDVGLQPNDMTTIVSVSVEPWTGWNGSAVTGEAGTPIVRTIRHVLIDDLELPESVAGLPGLKPVRWTDKDVDYGCDRWGSRVVGIKRQTLQVAQPVRESHWPEEDDDTGAEVLTDRENDLRFRVDVPPPNYATLCLLTTVLDNGKYGWRYPLTVYPTGTEPDILTSLLALVNDEDGSVTIEVQAVDRTQSYRYAYNVGQNPAWPTMAEIEAGDVREIVGSDTVELPADTVGWNEMIRVRAIPYTGADGTGTDGVEDHGEARAAEDIRLKPPVSLEETTVSETSTTGTHGVTVRDPGGYATNLYRKTKAGEASWTDWVLETGSPANGTEYTADFALIEQHQSAVKWRLEYEFHGASGHIEVTSPGFDKGAIPNGIIGPRINEDTGAASATLIGDSDTHGWKVLASTSAYPSITSVRAASEIVGRTLTPADVGTLLTATVGQTVYYSALAIGVNGDESSALITAEAQYKLIPPVLEVDLESESGSTGTFRVRVKDPGGQADALYYRTKSGDGSWSSWTLKTGSPADNATYSETVTLREKHLSFIEFRLDYTFASDAQSIPLKSSGFDRGKIPNVVCVPAIDEEGRVVLAFTGDFDTGSIKNAVSTSGYPSISTVRGASTTNGRSFTTSTVATLEIGETLYVGFLGFSSTGGGGNEQSELGQVQVTRGAATVRPQIQVSAVRSGDEVTVTLEIDDEHRVISAIQFRAREGGGSLSGWLTSWDTSSGTIGSSSSLTRGETIDVSDGSDSEFHWRVTYTDEAGNSVTIGDTVPVANLQEVTKTIRFPYTALMPLSDSTAYSAGTIGLSPGDLNLAVFTGTVVFPKGVVLTTYSVRGNRGSASDSLETHLRKLEEDGTGASAVASASHATTGWATFSDTLNETVGDASYIWEVRMNADAVASSVGVKYAEIEYDMSTYNATY